MKARCWIMVKTRLQRFQHSSYPDSVNIPFSVERTLSESRSMVKFVLNLCQQLYRDETLNLQWILYNLSEHEPDEHGIYSYSIPLERESVYLKESAKCGERAQLSCLHEKHIQMTHVHCIYTQPHLRSVVSFELHAHSNPFLLLAHAGRHGGTRFVKESPFLREGLDRTFDKCKASFLSSFSSSRWQETNIYSSREYNMESYRAYT